MNRTLVFLSLVLGLFAAACSSAPTFERASVSPGVSVEDQGGWIVVKPTRNSQKPVGLVYYPGGFVKPESYLLALAPLAEAGYPVVIVKMPFDLAFFDAEKGVAAKTSVPSVTKWVIGGHSLGGVAAAIAMDKHRDDFAGIIFWASYPAKDNDLSKTSVPALSISASSDGLSTPDKLAAAAPYLPAETVRIVIEGGNHAQFGDYGPQKGDLVPTISGLDQQTQANRAVLEFLAQL